MTTENKIADLWPEVSEIPVKGVGDAGLSTAYEPVSEGTHRAVIIAVEYVGYQKVEFKGESKTKPLIHISYEVDEKIESGEFEGKNKTIWQYSIPASLYRGGDGMSQAKLVGMVESISKIELKSLTQVPELLLGKTVALTVGRTSTGKHKVVAVAPAMKGVLPMPQSEPYKRPQWVQEQIDARLNPDGTPRV